MPALDAAWLVATGTPDKDAGVSSKEGEEETGWTLGGGGGGGECGMDVVICAPVAATAAPPSESGCTSGGGEVAVTGDEV